VLEAGREYRLRLVNILPAAPVLLELLSDSVLVRWTAIAKDGAELPLALVRESSARLRVGVGETYDFRWRPERAGELELVATGGPRDPLRVRQRIEVRAQPPVVGR
jgi:hypothetical protein